ncbi:peptidoglycan DD-metalloendopeptidase family protein [Mucilaginibacter arboris]|uniref:Peptidoglycan DD-metalloendopeptidase family protein n=1 Tax=Mucilaginibacter arboris TaxID=2682090 RepID=A0A7K1SUJ7_9SPHI|nr:peptidoglycan DD-metalloendopeptidase family protein [Mucilaginibacter arboris]MVN20964.1 peptidoglycan DD-metalloendopeptidase family protein [Mucilaginibacter arboris]
MNLLTQSKLSALIWMLLLATIFSCNSIGPAGLFKKMSPHDTYGNRLKTAGLQQTAIGSQWLQMADQSLGKAIHITIPYKETGFFAAERVQAATFQFEGKRGEKLYISLSKNPAQNFNIFIDLWQQKSQQNKLLASADTSGKPLTVEVKQGGTYLLRLQPELLKSGEYTLIIQSGPALAFPVAASGKPNIGSFYGADRDAGIRKHEGVDIFAKKGTPALAAANGIAQPGENKLGGKVVFLHPDDADYTLYYAHLDSQLVHNGQHVSVGDTVGLVGNTGNAKTTPSHLHFGIYTNGGAVNPLTFVAPVTKKPEPVTAPLQNLNTMVRTDTRNSKLLTEATEKAPVKEALPEGTALHVDAAVGNYYKVTLPNGQTGFLNSKSVNTINAPLRKYTLKTAQPLYNQPDTLSPKKTILAAGKPVNVLAGFESFYLIEDGNETGWLKK